MRLSSIGFASVGMLAQESCGVVCLAMVVRQWGWSVGCHLMLIHATHSLGMSGQDTERACGLQIFSCYDIILAGILC